MQILTIATVMISWAVLGAAMVFRRRSARSQERRRDTPAMAGLLLQGIGLGFAWSIRRNLLTPILFSSPGMQWLVAAFTMLLSLGSACLVVWALSTLGKQWSIAARLLNDHQLVIHGPYRLVRHPIYSGMFGLMIATGLALSVPMALLYGVPIFWLGTLIRMRSEEKLLREEFGEQYQMYKEQVPAILPRILSVRKRTP